MSSCSAASPMVCHPNYVQFNRPEVVTVVYAEPMCSGRQALTLEVVESNSGTIVAREAGRWNGDRVFSFTCPPLTTFGYHEVTPIIQREGRERKLPTFSVCCSISWQLSEQLHHLSCSDSLLHVCLVALHLCRSPEQARDPYWDVMCQMALDGCVKQPHSLISLGFPGAASADVPIRELFGNMFKEQTLQQFLDKHKLNLTSQTLSAMSASPQDNDGYEDLDTLRNTSVTAVDYYDDVSCVAKYNSSNPTPGHAPNPTPGHTPSPTPGHTPNPTPGRTSSPSPGYSSRPNSTDYTRMIKANPAHPHMQPGPAHPQMQPGPGHPHMQPGPTHPQMQPGPAHPHMQPGPAHPHMQPGPSHPHMQPGPTHPQMQPGPTHPQMQPGPTHPHMQPGPAHPHMQPGPAHPHMQPGPTHPQMQPGPAHPHMQPGPAHPHMQPGPTHPQMQPGPAHPHMQPGPAHPQMQPGPTHPQMQPGPAYPQMQPGPAHPQMQPGPPPCPPPQSKKPPLVSPKPGPAVKPKPKPIIEEDYTPYTLEDKQEDEDLSDGEEYMVMEDSLDRRPNYSTSTLTRGRTPEVSGARQRSRSAHSHGHCKMAPVTPVKANVPVATKGSHSKVPIQPPHSKTLPSVGVGKKGKTRK